MSHFLRVFVFYALFSQGIQAAEDPAAAARSAMAEIEAASAALEDAMSARDRVRALTETISAFENGLAALRAGQRVAKQRSDAIRSDLLARDAETAALLAALQRLAADSSPAILLHPEGPAGGARAGMLLADTAPELSRQADVLRQDLQDLQMLSDLQTDAARQLASGLEDIQRARTALNAAVSDRTDLPKRFTNDPVREAILIASAETLDSFARGLDRLAVDVVSVTPDNPEFVRGDLPLPVLGAVLRRANEADAAGISRPGIIVATEPGAIVTSPSHATIRYTGSLLDMGQVVIIEPQSDVLFILAGLGTIYGAPGEIVDAGDPLGLMEGSEIQTAGMVSTDGDQAGAGRTETLYIEVRENNAPEDPEIWFRTDKDG